MNKINFGFSLGFLTNLNTPKYKATMEYVINHGLNRFRVYEPFCKGWPLEKITDTIRFIATGWDGRFNHWDAQVLISMSNIPFEWLSDYSQAEIDALSPVQKRAMEYTNRFPPKPHRIQEYKDLIQAFIDSLDRKGVLQNCSFETGNEPDAASYAWMNYDEFFDLNHLRRDALSQSGRPVLEADFTSSLFRDMEYKNKSAYWRYATSGIKNLSHSFYHNDSSGQWFDFDNNNYPTGQFDSITISEYNCYTSYKTGSDKEKLVNSDWYNLKMFEFLRFMEKRFLQLPPGKEIDVYIHPLFQTKHGVTGNMAFYKDGAPSEACKKFMAIWDGIKYGYEMLPDGVRGANKTMRIDGTGKVV